MTNEDKFQKLKEYIENSKPNEIDNILKLIDQLETSMKFLEDERDDFKIEAEELEDERDNLKDELDNFLENCDDYDLVYELESRNYIVKEKDEVDDIETEMEHTIDSIFYAIMDGRLIIKDLTLRNDLDRLFESFLNRTMGQNGHGSTGCTNSEGNQKSS